MVGSSDTLVEHLFLADLGLPKPGPCPQAPVSEPLFHVGASSRGPQGNGTRNLPGTALKGLRVMHAGVYSDPRVFPQSAISENQLPEIF